MIIHGDATKIPLADNSVDTCITDPPYHLTSITKRFGKENSAPAKYGTDGVYARASAGFMGKTWDGGDIAFDPSTWAEVYRVLKPGAMLLSFGAPRTYHRMVCAIEDAGFEIRDTIGWVYGSGFPKSYDISKGIEAKMTTGKSSPLAQRKTAMGEDYEPSPLAGTPNYGVTGNFANKDTNSKPMTISSPEAQLWDGWGTALKPAMELIVVAMKPLDGTYVENALKWGVAGMWIDGGRIDFKDEADYLESTQKNRHGDFNSNNGIRVPTKGIYHGDNRPPVNYEPKQGRFPSNFTHDGSDEVLELFPDTGKSTGGRIGNKGSMLNMMGTEYEAGDPGYGDEGSAARFFYTAKASRSERNAGLEDSEPKWVDETRKPNSIGGNNPHNRGARADTNHHPCVKPLSLMRYLVRLTKTPYGGIVLDPFMGSGTTGCACALEGREFIGIEKEAEYVEIAEKRIAYWSKQPRLV